MIGVIASPSDHSIVSEFFELFKTPWEFYRSDRRYKVVLYAGDGSLDRNIAKLVIVYGDRQLPFDTEEKIQIASIKNNTVLSYKGTRLPIYGGCISFQEKGTCVLVDEETQHAAIFQHLHRGGVVARVGYDLFEEVRLLLTKGQPVTNAGIPALDIHIRLLRDLIIASGAPLVEIPPVPNGYRFIACLTHDVDHPSIRQHKFDHTMFGFLYRAVFGSFFDVLRGHRPWRKLVANWVAALKLPFVHLGLAEDFWYQFDAYAKLEKGLRSTFFVIPFKKSPGRSKDGSAPSRRASLYGAADVTEQIRRLISGGCEVGLHGIDAWLDSSSGQKELEQIRRTMGVQNVGVRMHWLYFDEQSPLNLERAGADYDSTVGYNETVGYRAGTTQAYKPLEVSRLLELPLHVMDTALFYPSHLDLSPAEASKYVRNIIDNAVEFGGSVTFNWHDRSIAPERLWGDFYLQMVDELKNKGAWFATCSEAVSWFRKRRTAAFEYVNWESDSSQLKIAVDRDEDLPGLCLRIHEAQETRNFDTVGAH